MDNLTSDFRPDSLASQEVDERRSEVRVQTVLQVAKLTTYYGEDLCILRNVSSSGLRADVYRPLTAGDSVLVELKTARKVTGTVIWTDGYSIGIKFNEKIPILSYLAHHTLEQLGKRIRAPRVRIGEAGTIRVCDREFSVEIVDVSLAGARVRTDRVLFAGGPCHIFLGRLGERSGLVRWYKDGHAGIMLRQPLTFDDFAKWRQLPSKGRTG